MMPKAFNEADLVDWIRTQVADVISVQAVILCGSRARGTHDLVSDIDLLVVIEGSIKYLQWGTWQGIPIEVMYVPGDLVHHTRPGLLEGRRILWQREDFDSRRVPESRPVAARVTSRIGYTGWDLRQALKILEALLREGDTAAFWYGVGVWMSTAVQYVLESKKIALPTHRRQWPLLEAVAPETATILDGLFAIRDPQRLYPAMVHVMDNHLKVPPWRPLQESPMVPLDSTEPEIQPIHIRKLDANENALIGCFWETHWGSAAVVSLGVLHDPDHVLGWIAEDESGVPRGLVTVASNTAWEVVSLDSDHPGRGIGSRLLGAVELAARHNGVKRLWLITSNDNLEAVRFYQKRGWDLVQIHRGAIDRARMLKPEIPIAGRHGIAIHHEIELEKVLN